MEILGRFDLVGAMFEATAENGSDSGVESDAPRMTS